MKTAMREDREAQKGFEHTKRKPSAIAYYFSVKYGIKRGRRPA
jgi:hypothetical protein